MKSCPTPLLNITCTRMIKLYASANLPVAALSWCKLTFWSATDCLAQIRALPLLLLSRLGHVTANEVVPCKSPSEVWKKGLAISNIGSDSPARGASTASCDISERVIAPFLSLYRRNHSDILPVTAALHHTQ